MNSSEERILAFIQQHRGKIVGGLIGFLLAVLFLVFGFFKTLFVLACVAVGVYFGSRRENRDRVFHYFAQLFPDNQK